MTGVVAGEPLVAVAESGGGCALGTGRSERRGTAWVGLFSAWGEMASRVSEKSNR